MPPNEIALLAVLALLAIVMMWHYYDTSKKAESKADHRPRKSARRRDHEREFVASCMRDTDRAAQCRTVLPAPRCHSCGALLGKCLCSERLVPVTHQAFDQTAWTPYGGFEYPAAATGTGSCAATARDDLSAVEALAAELPARWGELVPSAHAAHDCAPGELIMETRGTEYYDPYSRTVKTAAAFYSLSTPDHDPLTT